jgi:hypothetical protein
VRLPARLASSRVFSDVGMERRRLLTGLLSMIAAPAIVRPSSLMPIFPIDPTWIGNHQNHPVFGRLVVRMRNARNLESFGGVIQPGQFFWRKGDRLVDICVFPRTRLDVTPGMLSVRNLDRNSLDVDLGIGVKVGPFNEMHVHAHPVIGTRGSSLT